MLCPEVGPFKHPKTAASPKDEFISHQLYYTHCQQELGSSRFPELLQRQRQMKQPDRELWERICTHKNFLRQIADDSPAKRLVELTDGFPNRSIYLRNLNDLLSDIVKEKQADQNLSEEDQETLLMIFEIVRSWINDPHVWFYVYWEKNTESDLGKAVFIILQATSNGLRLRILDLSTMHRKIEFKPVPTRLYLIILLSFWQARIPGFRQIRAYLCNQAQTMLDNFVIQSGQNFDRAVALSKYCNQICGADYVLLVFEDHTYKLFPAELFQQDKILLIKYSLFRGKENFVSGDRPTTKAMFKKAEKVVTGRDDFKDWKPTGKNVQSAQALLTFSRYEPCLSPDVQRRVKVFVSPASQCSGPIPADELALIE
ncbi:MAG: hypothetical protein ABIH67_05140 [Candidatus Uhrbacteria bacterium]